MATANLETALRRDRLWVLFALSAVTLLAWMYLIDRAADMATGMMQLRPWTGTDAVMMFLMWVIMMGAMMLPSAAPMILLHARICRRRLGDIAPSGAFLGGYVSAWTVYSAGATGLQWALEQAALLSPMMVSTSPLFGALVLIAAGAYQFTPWKNACLSHCRSPIDFLAGHWRDGSGGAFRMGRRGPARQPALRGPRGRASTWRMAKPRDG